MGRRFFQWGVALFQCDVAIFQREVAFSMEAFFSSSRFYIFLYSFRILCSSAGGTHATLGGPHREAEAIVGMGRCKAEAARRNRLRSPTFRTAASNSKVDSDGENRCRLRKSTSMPKIDVVFEYR